MLQIQSPFPQFTDLDGSPLDDGSVYLGVAGQNPETNPLPVYWDDAGTMPAAQPLKTSSGYIVRAGAPAVLYTSQTELSMTVRDKKGLNVFSTLNARLHYSAADSTQIVSNVATLRNIAPDASLTIQTRGYYTDGDYGQGHYYAKVGAAPGTYVDNGGTVIVPTGGNGSAAWFLMVDGTLVVQQFGTRGDLLANDYAPFQACLTAASAAGYSVYAAKCVGFRIDSPLSFDIAAVSLDLGGNRINFPNIGAVTAFLLNTDSQSDENIAGMYVKLHPIKNGFITGPGPSVTGSKCFDFTGSPKWIHSVTVSYCSITGFDNDIRVFTNGFLIEFDHCNFLAASATFDTNTVLLIPAGGNNYGEAIKFNSCQFSGAGCVANVGYFSSVFFNNCSFDYNDRIFLNSGGGDIIAVGCHIESTVDVNYWFETISENSTIKLIGCPILLSGTKTKAIGNSGSAAGGISLVGCSIEGVIDYTVPDELITGTGRVKVTDLSYHFSGTKIIPSNTLNLVPFGGTFEDASSLLTWKLGGTIPPTRSSTAAHSGTWSMNVVGAAGTTNYGGMIVPVEPGDTVFIRAWYYTPNISGTGGTFSLTAIYCDALGNVVLAGDFVSVVANMAGWARAKLDFQPVVPPGATHVKFQASVFGISSGSPNGYIDDVIIVKA